MTARFADRFARAQKIMAAANLDPTSGAPESPMLFSWANGKMRS